MTGSVVVISLIVTVGLSETDVRSVMEEDKGKTVRPITAVASRSEMGDSTINSGELSLVNGLLSVNLSRPMSSIDTSILSLLVAVHASSMRDCGRDIDCTAVTASAIISTIL